MEELRKRLDIAERSFFTLQESLDSPFSNIVRDSCLLRFAYTYDCCWKLLKKTLEIVHGVICHSPKSCIREVFSNRILSESDAELWLTMVNDRNQIAHSYVESIAQSLYNQLPKYAESLNAFLGNMRSYIDEK